MSAPYVIAQITCRIAGCRNEARYHVWAVAAYTLAPQYCGVCDIEHNAGRGKLKGEIEAPKPMDDRQLVVGLRSDHELIEELRSQLQAARASLENHATETAWDKGIIKNLTAKLHDARAEYERSVTALRDELKDAHDLGKRLLSERNAARAAAADYHKDCISGEEIAALRALGPPCGCAACRLFWSKK